MRLASRLPIALQNREGNGGVDHHDDETDCIDATPTRGLNQQWMIGLGVTQCIPKLTGSFKSYPFERGPKKRAQEEGVQAPFSNRTGQGQCE